MNEPKGPDLESGIDISSIPDGGMRAGHWRGTAVLLAKERGTICALSARCTHMDAPLNEGILANGEVHCPWHHAQFSLVTGEAVGAPAFAPLTCFETTIRDGRVFVGEPRLQATRATPAQTPRVVILGGGAAGYACAEWLARSGFAGALTIVSDDADPPYDRTVCSKQYLSGQKSRDESLLLDDSQPYQKRLAESALRLECKARAIDVRGKSLLLEGGEHIDYEVLVLATGAEPKRAGWPGYDLPNVYLLRTLRDADALIAASVGAKRVAVIGASFSGLEVAASLKQRELDVHVVTKEDVPLQKIVGADVGSMIRNVHVEKGVQFHFGCQVREFDGRLLKLDDETTIDVDFVVLAIGVTPRTEIAQAAGIACAPEEQGGGVLVNQRLESSHAGIFAIGDIARYPDPHTGKVIRVEHWVHAQRQGQHVARVILGETAPYADVPFFWSAHFDTGLRYLGHVGPIAEVRTDGSVDKRDFSRCYLGAGGDRAFVTCNRDEESLVEEATWDRALGRR